MRTALVVAALAALVVVASAEAQNFGGPTERFRVEWRAAPGASGGAQITGRLHNDHLQWATDIRLRIDTLDAAGQTLATAFTWAPGTVPAGGRLWFNTRVPIAGAAYRVTVTSFELIDPRP